VIGREQRLRLALAGIDADVVLIDCPGSVSTITISALVAANAILTVTQPTMKEIAGVPEMLDAVQAVQEAFNPNLVFAGIVPCIVPPATHGKIYADVDLTSSREKLGRPTFAASTARSYHPGGVNALLGDGSVRFVKDTLDGRIWRALGTVGGGEVLSADAY